MTAVTVIRKDACLLFDEGSAAVSSDGVYRYRLTRRWRAEGTTVLFVMLNPSTADHMVNDPTIRRCITFAKVWGHAALDVVNLFALRATDPTELQRWPADHARGPENAAHVIAAIRDADMIVAAWGAWAGPHPDEAGAVDVVGYAASIGRKLWCLGTTQGGMPRHPLYVKADQPLVPFR